jgi:Zn-dependent protease
VQALLWAIVLMATLAGGVLASEGLSEMARIGVNVNLVLMALNILPIPPLDGGRVLAGLLPGRAAYAFSRVEPYGLFIVLALLFTGFLGDLMRPLIRAAERLIVALLGLV